MENRQNATYPYGVYSSTDVRERYNFLNVKVMENRPSDMLRKRAISRRTV